MREFNKIFDQKFNSEDEYQIADFYHINSEIDKINLASHIQKIDEYYNIKSENKKQKEDRFPFSKKISLSEKKSWLYTNFKRLLLGRRSRRNFTNKTISLSEISNILNLSYGRIKFKENIFSTIPSAGAIFPLHVYLLCINTEIKKGIYHYYFLNNYLDELAGDAELEKKISETILIKNLESFPPLFLVITGDLRDICLKYGDRGYRFALIESGHLAQNLLLVAEHYKFNAVPLGGYIDKEVAKMINIDYAFEKPLYIIALGKR